jgi:hypothetical protein
MRVENTGARPVEQAGGAGEKGAVRANSAAQAGAGASSLALSPELAALLAALRQLPEVRPEAVAVASGNLAQSNLLAPATLAATADAVLSAGAEPPPTNSAWPADRAEPSPQLLALVAALQQVPQVRPDAVAEATGKVASGDLLTPDAIRRTASALLG